MQPISELVPAVVVLKGHVIFIISKIDANYLTSLSDIYVIYLIHYQMEGTVVNGKNTACHGLYLVLDISEKVLKFLVFLFNSSLYLSVFVIKPLLMYSLYCSILQLVRIFNAYGKSGCSY